MVQLQAGNETRWRRVAKLILGVNRGAFDNLIVTMRAIFLRLVVLMAALAAPMLVASEASPAWRGAGGAALAGLAAWWLRGHQRGGFSGWMLVCEAVALTVLGIAVGDPPRLLGVMYGALNYRAFFGRPRDAVALASAYVAAHAGAVVVAGLLGFAPATTTLTAPGIIQQVPGFAVTALMIRLLVMVAGRREKDARRQQVLADAGAALGAAERRADVARAASDGVVALMALDGAGRSAVAFAHDGGFVIAASTDVDLVGTTLESVTDLVHGPADPGSRSPTAGSMILRGLRPWQSR